MNKYDTEGNPLWFLIGLLLVVGVFAYFATTTGKPRAVTIKRGNFTVECDSTAEQGACTLFWRDGRQGKVCDDMLVLPVAHER